MGQPAPQIPTQVYATLAGPIDQAMVQRVFQGLNTAVNGRAQNVHVLLQSNGGSVGDAFAIYGYLRSLPIEVNIYNCGTIASAAVTAFLGAHKRYASAYATFVIHRTFANAALLNSAASANAARLRSLAQAFEIEDARTRAILRTNLSLTDERLDECIINEAPIDATEALNCGLITGIRDFSPPPGQTLYNI